MRVLSLCDGMSCGYLAFKQLGITPEYWAVEIDKFARALSDSNLKDIKRPCHNVNEIGARQMLLEWPAFDWVIFGSPCQSVSVAGKGEGLDGTSGLLLKCMEILALAKYRNPSVKFLIENVKMKKDFKAQFDQIIGGESILINSALVSAQNRERWYWTNFPVSQPDDRGLVIADILEDQDYFSEKEKSFCIDANYHKGASADEYLKKSRRQIVFKYSESNRYTKSDGTPTQKASEAAQREVERRMIPSDKSLTLTTGDGCGSGMKAINLVHLPYASSRAHQNFSVVEMGQLHYRKLTVRECARLQTIPEWYVFSAVSKTQAYKAIGNAWCVNVIAHIISEALASEMRGAA